jgi:predicted ATPase/DNA-binding SARP family transcriptional activator
MPCYNVGMAGLSISLLGRFAVQLGDHPLLTFRTKSVSALLIILASETRETNLLRREWLTELLWPDQPAGAGRKNLRQSLYELRQAIPEVAGRENPKSPHAFVLADRQTINLNRACDYRVDTAEFESLLANGEIDALRQAIEVYQGDFLADFYLPESSAFEDWAAAKRALYSRLALDAMERVGQHELQQGRYEAAAGLARRQLEIDNLRETALRQLMVALALSGQRNAALAQYEESRAEFSQELGVEPEVATQAVYERITLGQLQPAGDEILILLQPEDEIPLTPPSGEVATSNLPTDPTPFVGREQEVATITQRLLDPSCRLLTILGPGGCGKSRVAIQAARYMVEEHPDSFPAGIWYASLTKLSDTDQIISALVESLPFNAFDPDSDIRSQLFSFLRGRQMLLVLDNMEYAQVPEGVQFLSELLDRAPSVTLLACSRTRLNLRAEQLFPLAGLDVPDVHDLSPEAAANYSALQLFVNSARRVRPDFGLTTDTIPPVLAICQQLQGIPLAIELAAAWVEVMAPSEVAGEVERCFDFLETDWVDVPERQRSLRAVFETSWRLLNGQERAAFLRLSVFRGGFDFQSARQIADASQRTLLGLFNKSWLQRDESGRYLAHEMLRQYAYQLLSDDDLAWASAHDRHSVYFAEMTHAQGELLKGPQQITATEQIEVELENIIATWEWLVQSERYEILIDQMLPGLFLYFAARSRGQQLVSLVKRVRQQMESSKTTIEPSWQVILLTVQAAFFHEFLISRHLNANPYPPSGQEQIGAAYEIAHKHGLEDRLGIWSLLLARQYGWAIDRTTAFDWMRRLLEVHRAGDDTWLLALTLENLGGLLLPTGLGRPGGPAGTDEAERCLAEAVSLFERLGDQREKGYTLGLLGLLTRREDFSDSKQMLLAAQRALEIAGDPVMATRITGALADVSVQRGEASEGFEYSQRVRREAARLGYDHIESSELSWESMWALRLDTIEHARKARQESLSIAKRSGDEIVLAWGIWELGEIERVASNYDQARDLFEQAQQLLATLEDPYAPAFLERGLGDLAYDLGHYEESLRYFRHSLHLAEQVSHQWAVAYAYFGLGRATLALAKDGQKSEISQAQDYFLEGLRGAYYHQYREQYTIGVAGLAACYAASGRAQEALQLAQIVLACPITWQEIRRRTEKLQVAILTKQPDLANHQESELPDIQSFVKELLEPTPR